MLHNYANTVLITLREINLEQELLFLECMKKISESRVMMGTVMKSAFLNFYNDEIKLSLAAVHKPHLVLFFHETVDP